MIHYLFFTDEIQPSPRDRVNSLEVKLPPHRSTVGSNPLREIPERSAILDVPDGRPRSDSDSFIEDVSVFYFMLLFI